MDPALNAIIERIRAAAAQRTPLRIRGGGSKDFADFRGFLRARSVTLLQLQTCRSRVCLPRDERSGIFIQLSKSRVEVLFSLGQVTVAIGVVILGAVGLTLPIQPLGRIAGGGVRAVEEAPEVGGGHRARWIPERG